MLTEFNQIIAEPPLAGTLKLPYWGPPGPLGAGKDGSGWGRLGSEGINVP